MLKDQTLKVVVTFPNMTTALAMEAACKEDGIPGRIIPVPNQISAGCGFSWCADAGEKQRIEAYVAEKKLLVSAVHLIEL